MWVLVALITVAGATSPVRGKRCPVYSSPCKPVDCGPNAYWETCPPQCPPHQNCSLLYSKFPCVPDENYCCKPACRCKDGFFRNENFKCVTSKDCSKEVPIDPKPEPGCKANETYVNCKVECPNNYCPVNDNRGILICDPPRPCPPGCVCNLGYRRKSKKDKTCILAEECPPVKCTRPNEVWSPCPSSCLAESCSDVNNQPTTCNDLVHNCQPRCICAEGYFRNDNEVCVPAKECQPPKNDCRTNETFVDCAVRCGPYDNCPVDDSRAIVLCSPPFPCPSGCVCQTGYRRRSAENDTCILAEECPPVECTRPNEVWNSCPSGCRAEYCTEISNQPSACNELVKNCNPKCICAEGYYRNGNDICVLATECGEANCGANKTIVFCTFKCPNQFCPESDSLDVYACKPPRDCPPGCGCKVGYRYKSSQDDTCVLARDCPPVTCTRPNEEWNPCPPPCYSDVCEDRNKTQSECYENEDYCDPKCVCIQGYYRNANKICVPARECD